MEEVFVHKKQNLDIPIKENKKSEKIIIDPLEISDRSKDDWDFNY